MIYVSTIKTQLNLQFSIQKVCKTGFLDVLAIIILTEKNNWVNASIKYLNIVYIADKLLKICPTLWGTSFSVCCFDQMERGRSFTFKMSLSPNFF